MTNGYYCDILVLQISRTRLLKMVKTYKAVLYWTSSLTQDATPFFTESELISEAKDHCTQTGEEDEKDIVSVDDAIRYLEDQGWFPIKKTTQYFKEEEIEKTSAAEENLLSDENDKKMFEYLPELMYELTSRGFDWEFPVEAMANAIRVKEDVSKVANDIVSSKISYTISRQGKEFEVICYIKVADGERIEATRTIRETIGQVADYILE